MDFLGIGPLELVVILVVALLVLGPQRMAQAGRRLGRFVREFRQASRTIPDMVEELLEEPEEPRPPGEAQPWNPPGRPRPAGDSGEGREEKEG